MKDRIKPNKPKGYWTKERCHEEALKYKSIKDFYSGSTNVYKFASKKGWLKDISSHLKSNRKHNGYWTKERCHEESLKYNVRKEFQYAGGGAFHAARENGWIEEICSHMKVPVYWTKERCQEYALKYKTRKDFENLCSGGYKTATRHGWLDEICSHMIYLKLPAGYWTKQRCHNEALKYNDRLSFVKNSKSAYDKASKMNWLDEICTHMKYLSSLKDRFIYSFEFPKYNSAYVGLTWNVDKRKNSHLNSKKSSVYKFMLENNLTENDFILKVHGRYDMNIVSEKESEKESEYKQNGWVVLNKAKTGNLGGSRTKWTKNKCKEISEKVSSKKELKTLYKGCYDKCYREGWIYEFFPK